MRELLLGVAAVIGLLAIVYALLQQQRMQRIARERLYEGPPDGDGDDDARSDGPVAPFARRHWVLPWLIALVLALLLIFAVGLPLSFSFAFAAIAGLLLGQLDAWWLSIRQDRIQTQLADAIDLMVSAVKAGSSLQNALEYAARDSAAPLRNELQEVVGRIRLGDDAGEALEGLVARVPLESFRLLATSLMVNWGSGGSLAATLAKVGRTIRDRIELTRRMRALTTQARASVISILLVTYFIAALMWRNDPERMSAFVASFSGQLMIAGAMVMQGIGIVWIGTLSRLRF
jgi:tight adherence protein B